MAGNQDGRLEPASRAVVVIGASAGGLQTLKKLLSALPRDFPAPVLVVQHLSPRYKSHVAEILDGCTGMRVKEAEEGDRMVSGAVYVAPPNRHLLVTGRGTLTLSYAETVHFVRPSIDLLFESAATTRRDQTVGVILSGTGSDGAAGVRAIKQMGGKVIVQTEATAEFPGMPRAAIETGMADFVLPLDEIADKLELLTAQGDPR